MFTTKELIQILMTQFVINHDEEQNKQVFAIISDLSSQ